MDSTQNKSGLQERIFQKLFISDSLKYYRDLKNVVDSAFDEGEEKGKMERTYELAKGMKAKYIDVYTISEITGLSVDEIEKL